MRFAVCETQTVTSGFISTSCPSLRALIHDDTMFIDLSASTLERLEMNVEGRAGGKEGTPEAVQARPRPISVDKSPSCSRTKGQQHRQYESYLRSPGRHHTPPGSSTTGHKPILTPHNTPGIQPEQPHYVQRHYPKRARSVVVLAETSVLVYSQRVMYNRRLSYGRRRNHNRKEQI